MADIEQHPDKPDYFKTQKAVMIYDDYKKVKPELKEIYQSISRPIAVLGGGPSLPKDMESLPDDCILISCNHHAFRLVKPDYMVFLDSPNRIHAKQEFKDHANKNIEYQDYERISFKELDHTDYYTINEFPKELQPCGDTGMFGLWVACYLTSGNVYLCGMDCRQNGEPQHFYDSGTNVINGGPPLHLKMQKWSKVISFCENTSRIRPVSGPIKELI